MQFGLLAFYRAVAATGALYTSWGRTLFEKAYWLYKGRYEAGPVRALRQRVKPGTVVVATGETHSVRELVETAFDCAGLDWQKYVVQDPALMRPAEADFLVGDASKARRERGWKPEVDFTGLVHIMV